jgi:PEP-CTERM motif
MFARQQLFFSLAFALSAGSASADLNVYAVSTNFNTFIGRFGTVDLTTGAFNQIGPAIADPLSGLLPQPNGSLLSISASGNLDSVNPASGAVSVIGATGLGNLAYDIAELNGTVYATDLNSNLYTVNTTTGTVTLIGATGIPPCPSLTNPADISDETLFAAGGQLYATFDGINLMTSALVNSPELYQINPATGIATPVGSTALGLDAAVQVNGVVYGFDFGYTGSNTVPSLNLANGNTTFVTDYVTSPVANGPNAFDIEGAAPTPEPASFPLVGAGIGLIFLSVRRKRRDLGVEL